MKIILVVMATAMVIGLAKAETIEFNFNDNDGVVDVNTFGSGVTVSDLTITHDNTGSHDFNASTWDLSVTDGMARGGARKASQGGLFMSFSVTIDAATTVDLTGLTWENGLDFNGADMTPLWSLSIDNGGSATPASGSNARQVDAGFYGENKAVSLSGLTGLNDATVTFTWDFTQEERANAVNIIANTMDDIVLTGTIPEPATMGLISVVGGCVLFIRRIFMV